MRPVFQACISADMLDVICLLLHNVLAGGFIHHGYRIRCLHVQVPLFKQATEIHSDDMHQSSQKWAPAFAAAPRTSLERQRPGKPRQRRGSVAGRLTAAPR